MAKRVAEGPGRFRDRAVIRPLEFASPERIPAFAPRAVERLPSALAAARCRAKLRDALRTVRDRFRGPLEEDERRAAVQEALALLEPFASADYAVRALAQSPRVLAGLGPRRAEQLAKRGIRTVEDLLYRLPVGYDDRRSLASVGSLKVGSHVTFAACVLGSASWAGAAAVGAAGGCSRRGRRRDHRCPEVVPRAKR
jgi:hypothetical protein